MSAWSLIGCESKYADTLLYDSAVKRGREGMLGSRRKGIGNEMYPGLSPA